MTTEITKKYLTVILIRMWGLYIIFFHCQSQIRNHDLRIMALGSRIVYNNKGTSLNFVVSCKINIDLSRKPFTNFAVTLSVERDEPN